MSELVPVAFFGLNVSPGNIPTVLEGWNPDVHTMRITMAAIDPTAKALKTDQPNLAVLEIIRIRLRLRPDADDNEDMSDEDSEEKDGSADEGFDFEKLQLKFDRFILCTLDPVKQYQQTLDITIGNEDEVAFLVNGNYDVTLSGNYFVSKSYEPARDENGLKLMDLLNRGIDECFKDGFDDVDHSTSTVAESDEEEEKKPEPEKLTRAEKKSLKRAREEEAKPEEPKLSKKLKTNDGKAAEAVAETKKAESAKPIEQGPTEGQKAIKKVVKGVIIEDKKVGTGAVAKNGNKLDLRYVGKLKNGKVFDSNTKGKPFSLHLGKGEVIKGWDVGLAGMKVGGERRITVPPNMAYGTKGLPDIPANSELIFEVKLLNVK